MGEAKSAPKTVLLPKKNKKRKRNLHPTVVFVENDKEKRAKPASKTVLLVQFVCFCAYRKIGKGSDFASNRAFCL